MELLLQKTVQGLIPADDEAVQKYSKIKLGAIVRTETSEMRNAAFFRKWWALVKLTFDIWSDSAPTVEHKGVQVLPDFDRFRKDVTILAGFYKPVFNVKGELRLEPESLAWGSMDEERFEKLYSATIDAILQKVLPKAGLSEQELRRMVDEVVRFA